MTLTPTQKRLLYGAVAVFVTQLAHLVEQLFPEYGQIAKMVVDLLVTLAAYLFGVAVPGPREAVVERKPAESAS